MVENQFICFPDRTNANPTIMLPSAGLVANGVEMLFLLTPFGLIPNLNKLFRELMQAGIPFEPNDVLMLFFFTEVIQFRRCKATICADKNGADWNGLIIVFKKRIQKIGCPLVRPSKATSG